MAYIGTSPTQAVRTRFLYTATASQTTFSGADTQNLTLRYSDANFVDVYQNGVLLKGGGADYTATTTTSVVLSTGATADDVIEIIVYDVFAVANLIKKDGDTVEGVINFNGKEITLDADFDTSITADTDDQIDFKTGGTDRVVIDSSGNVGIADTTPEVKLTVVEAQDDIAVVKARTTTVNGRASYQIGNDADNWFMGIDGGNSDAFFIADAVGSGDKLVITQAGNVGLGTTSPGARLDVTSTDSDAVFLRSSQSTNTNVYITNTNATANNTANLFFAPANNVAGSQISSIAIEDFSSSANRTADLAFSTRKDGTMSERVRIDSSGNMGIGTTSPATKLSLVSDGGGGDIHVKNGSGQNALIELAGNNNTCGSTSMLLGQTSDGNANLFNRANLPLVFGTNNTEAMRIDSSGNVLIGKTSTGVSTAGVQIEAAGAIVSTRDGNISAVFNRESSDGDIVRISQAGSQEGVISVSGSTVSYNGFSGLHESSGIPTNTPIGTIVSTIDELDVYPNTQDGDAHPKAGQTRADHAKVKVSDTVGDKAVYGVVGSFNAQGKVNVASVGVGSVRVTGACAKGDLLESNGDGTAKVQSDDIVRSKTLGKVTIGNSNTGVKLVSCVIYCG